MLRQLARSVLTLILTGSLCLTAATGYRIAQNPLLRPLIDRSANEITAASDAMMASDATPELIAARLTALLAQPDRNWLAIEAIIDEANDRSLKIPPTLGADLLAAYAQDTGYLKRAKDCAACAYDPAQCDLSLTLICQAPMALTPLGDIAGVVLEGSNYATGKEVDEINLTLSLVGLAAVGLVIATGGSSTLVKIGASTGKLAHKMRLLSPRLTATILHATRTGVDWARLPAARSTDDLAALIRPAAVAPVVEVLTQTGRIYNRLDIPKTLHLLRYVDDADDARRLGNAAEALGPKAVGRLEILGKSRFLRATMKYSDTVYALLAGVLGLFTGIASLIGSMVTSRLTRSLRRTARRPRLT